MSSCTDWVSTEFACKTGANVIFADDCQLFNSTDIIVAVIGKTFVTEGELKPLLSTPSASMTLTSYSRLCAAAVAATAATTVLLCCYCYCNRRKHENMRKEFALLLTRTSRQALRRTIQDPCAKTALGDMEPSNSSCCCCVASACSFVAFAASAACAACTYCDTSDTPVRLQVAIHLGYSMATVHYLFDATNSA